MANSDNPRKGADFERAIRAFFEKQGSEVPPVLVECKVPYLDRRWEFTKRQADCLERSDAVL